MAEYRNRPALFELFPALEGKVAWIRLGDFPTRVHRLKNIGKALGVQYEDNEELKAADKITEGDKHRWELDPASSDDYRDRD